MRVNNDGSINVKYVDANGSVIKAVRKFENISGAAGTGSDGDVSRVFSLITSDTDIDIVEVFLDGVLIVPTTSWTRDNTLKQVTMSSSQMVLNTQVLTVYYYV